MKKLLLLCFVALMCASVYADIAYDFEYTASNVDKCELDVLMTVRNTTPNVSVIADRCWGEYDMCTHTSYNKVYVLNNATWDFCWSQKDPSEVVGELSSISIDTHPNVSEAVISRVNIPGGSR